MRAGAPLILLVERVNAVCGRRGTTPPRGRRTRNRAGLSLLRRRRRVQDDTSAPDGRRTATGAVQRSLAKIVCNSYLGLVTDAEPRKRTVKRLYPPALKALAHPLRVRILASLRRIGPATATGLADRLGESSGLTSY